MAYVLHGARGSGSLIVEMALAVVGADYEPNDLDLRNHEQRGEDYASLNPHRKLPTLELGDGELLTETTAILITLDERHPDAGLFPPSGSKERAQALRWLAYLASEQYPIVEIIDYPERFTPASEDAEAIRERAKELWHERFKVVEANHRGSPYFLASGFCATDLYITVLSRWDMKEEWRRANLPKVEALAAAVRERDAIAPVWRRHFGR